MTTELLPCPFCGTTEPKEIPTFSNMGCVDTWSVTCRNPRCGGSTTQARLGWAITSWNMRWIDPSILENTAGYRFIKYQTL